MGIYEEYSNNSMIISNEFGIPPELLKTNTSGATYENQIQSVRRLYQDTIIPQVEEYDQYTNFRLNIQKHGVLIKTDWSHIPALAENEKDKAMSININGKTALDAYNNNVITWNDYLEMIGREPIDSGDVYKYQRIIANDTNIQS